MATHTDEDLDYALEVLEKLGREFGIIGSESRASELAQLAQAHFGQKPAHSAVVTAQL
jgi:hypothetical protein